MKLLYLATVDSGRLKISNRKQFDEDIKQFEGNRVELVLSKANKRRSNDQNAYYWGVVLPCMLQGFIDAGHTGLNIDDCHDYVKATWLSKGKEIINPKTGEVKIISKTTTILSTTEMMELIEEIARFCAEILNVVIPEPSPIWNVTNETI